MTNQDALWNGKHINKLEKDELIEIINELSKAARLDFERYREEQKMLKTLRDLK